MIMKTVNTELVLAIYFVWLGLVQSQPVICTGNQLNTSCTTSNNCETEPASGSKEYIQNNCDPEYTRPYTIMATSLRNMMCPGYEHCDIDEKSTRGEGKPKVQVTLETQNIQRFNVHITWKHNLTLARGYQVQVFEEDTVFPLECFCVNAEDAAKGLSIINSTHLLFKPNTNRRLTVAIAPYPLPVGPSSQQAITGQYSTDWPRSCLDLGTHNCYPPTYPAPSNIQLHTSIYNTSEGVETRRLDILWDAVMPNSSWNNTRDKLTYYIQLHSHKLDPYNVNRRPLGNSFFRVRSSGNSIQLSVSLFIPLNISVNYTHVGLQTHYPCAGVATSTRNIGCGNPSTLHLIPPPALPVPPSVMLSLTPTAVSPSPALQTDHVSTVSGLDSVRYSIIFAVIIVVVVIVVTTVVTVMFMRHKLRNRNSVQFSNQIIPLGISSETPPITLSENLESSETCTAAHLQSGQNYSSVFVFYSFPSENEEYILRDVVQTIRLSAGDSIDVIHPRQSVRDFIPQWIEDKVTKAMAVLVVCDEAFYNDWERERSPYIKSLKQIVCSKVANSNLYKFIVVILDDEEQYIPTEYLQNLKFKFYIRKNGDDDRELMVQFIKTIYRS